MIHKVIELYGAKAYTYFLNSSQEMRPLEKRPTIIICPGGAYRFTSDREAEPIAMQFMAMGYHAVVLRYSAAPERYPKQLLQVGSLMKYLKENAEEYHIDSERIFVMGFSAGGHLAASYGVFWDKEEPWNQIKASSWELKPAGLILCYPVISSGEYAHRESFRNLLGEHYEEMKDTMSLENQVTEQTPPTFLWHTITDNSVPVENSLLFFSALKKAGVSAELHIYPCGGHGLSLANMETSNVSGHNVQKECQSWFGLLRNWLEFMCE